MNVSLVLISGTGDVPRKQVDLSTQTISEDTVYTSGYRSTVTVVANETVTIDDAATVTVN